MFSPYVLISEPFAPNNVKFVDSRLICFFFFFFEMMEISVPVLSSYLRFYQGWPGDKRSSYHH
jgi:hypothetical protein